MRKLLPKLRRASILLFVLLFFVGMAEAAPPAQPKNGSDSVPLTVDADQTEMNFKTGINVYEGHVIAIHGQSVLKGNKIVTYRNQQNQLSKIVTTGQPATLHAAEQENDQPVDAKSDTIIFYPLTHEVVLSGNAQAIQGNNIIRAPTIKYNTETKVMEAQSNASQRMHMLIHNDSSSGKGAPS